MLKLVVGWVVGVVGPAGVEGWLLVVAVVVVAARWWGVAAGIEFG